MPRYYFTIKGTATVHDHEGAELASAAVAMEEAEASARELLAQRVAIGRDRRAWSIIVRDERGLEVGTIRFGETIEWDHLAQSLPTPPGDRSTNGER